MANKKQQDTQLTQLEQNANCSSQALAVLESLAMGIVIFDKKFKITFANTYSRQLIELENTISKSLSKGTDAKIWGDWQDTLNDVIQTGKTCRFDSVVYNSKKEQKLLYITIAPLQNSSPAQITGGAIVLENITHRANIQKQLADTERLAALGRLASKVAHELNNPIDGVMRYINLAKRMIDDCNAEKSFEYLDRAQQGLERMTQIITELLEFSRSRCSRLEDIPLNKIIDEAVDSLQHNAKAADVKILRKYNRSLPSIKSGALFQVFSNLIKNAIDAMPDGGTITISAEKNPENVAVIKIEDTGPGFAPENSEAIFEPFFTTKINGKGTGLGLAICKDIVEKYSGKITAENAQDHGSIFTIRLPIKQ